MELLQVLSLWDQSRSGSNTNYFKKSIDRIWTDNLKFNMGKAFLERIDSIRLT